MTTTDGQSAPQSPNRRWIWIALGATVTLLVAGGIALAVRPGDEAPTQTAALVNVAEPAEVHLEPTDEIGLDPFSRDHQITDATTFPSEVLAVAAAIDGISADPASGTLPVNGGTAKLYGGSPRGNKTLYGGSNELDVCDPQALIDFLAADPAKAAAWAGVHGKSADQIADFIRSLTPVVLLSDTAVTNHGFAGGRATSRQSVLQAGTAVLVDQFGVPVVRCACGNPLLAPDVENLPGAKFVGPPWAGFNPARVFSVFAASAAIKTFSLVDIVTGALLDRISGLVGETLIAVGGSGVALSDDGATWHAVPGSPAGRQIVAGAGVLVIPGATTMSSADGGLTWAAVADAPADTTFAAFSDGTWTLTTESAEPGSVDGTTTASLRATLHTSPDRTTWTAHDIDLPLENAASELTMGLHTEIRSIAAGAGRTVIAALVSDWSGANRQYLLSSSDLSTWQRTFWEAGAVVHPQLAWNGTSWGTVAFRYDGVLSEGNSHGLTGVSAGDLMSSTLAPTAGDTGLGSLSWSDRAGWIGVGWSGAEWENPGFYASTDLITWSRVGELPGYGNDVAAVPVDLDLSALAVVPTPERITGPDCAEADSQPIITSGSMSCVAMARVLDVPDGPRTGGNKVFPRWHHWGCSTAPLPDIEAGLYPGQQCGNGTTEFDVWPIQFAPTGGAPAPEPSAAPEPPPAPGPLPSGECVHQSRWGVHEYLLGEGSSLQMDCSDRIAVMEEYFDLQAAGQHSGDPDRTGWYCGIASADDGWYCSNDAAHIYLVPIDTVGAPAPDSPDPSSEDSDLGVSQPITKVSCDGTPIVIYKSAIDPATYAAEIQAALDAFPGSSYLRTDEACTSLAQSSGGNPIYVVFRAFSDRPDACAEFNAVVDAGAITPGKRLLDNGSPDTSNFTC